jgi:hypothetical protein
VVPFNRRAEQGRAAALQRAPARFAPGGGAAAGSATLPARNERSFVSFGSTETGWSRQSQRIISGSIAPPMSWLWTPMPQT